MTTHAPRLRPVGRAPVALRGLLDRDAVVLGASLVLAALLRLVGLGHGRAVLQDDLLQGVEDGGGDLVAQGEVLEGEIRIVEPELGEDAPTALDP